MSQALRAVRKGAALALLPVVSFFRSPLSAAISNHLTALLIVECITPPGVPLAVRLGAACALAWRFVR